MSASRLTLAREAGVLAWPDTGRILVLRPRAGEDLSALPKPRVHVVQGFRPDHDAFAAAGYATSPEPEGAYAAAIVFLPRAKAEAHAMIAEAAARLPEGAPLAIDGLKTDGVDSVLRDCRRLMQVGEAIAKAHGKIFVLSAPPAHVLADWAEGGADRRVEGGFVTRAGVFSADGINRGSAMLAAALPARLKGRGADLGAGWGYLAAEVLKRPDVREFHLVEAEKRALDCARLNVTDARAQFHWADATQYRPDQKFDFVITNPPFHTSRAADPALGAAFVRAAARMLAPSGSLWMVANRHLPYEKVLAECFREVEEAGGDAAFKITHAMRPQSGPR